MAKKQASQKEQPAKEGKKPWARVGSMNQARSGSYYLKFEQDVTIKAGETLLMRKPQEEVESLLQRGVIDETKAAERLEKIPEFVKFNLIQPPSDDSNF